MCNQKIIEVLGALITIINDRIEGCEETSEETEELNVKYLFPQFSFVS